MASNNVGVTGVSPLSPTPAPEQGEAQRAVKLSQPPARGEAAAEAKTPLSLSDAEVRRAAEALGEAISLVNRGIKINIDESTDHLITQIVNKETGEVIRQIPPQEFIEVIQRLREYIGLLLDIEI